MKRLLTTKGIGIMATVVLILAVAAAYVAAQGVFDKNVTASWSVQISGDAIQVFEQDGTTVVNAIDFGTSFTDFFGNIPQPTHKVVVKNLSATAVQVFATGDGADGIIPVFGPTTGDLNPQPDNLFVLQPQGQSGDMTMGVVGLTLPQLVSGSKTTTIIFRATEVGAGPTAIQPPAGMVGWWPGDGNAIDVVGGNAGILSGDATFTGGMVGQAFSFDGTGDSVVDGHDPSLNLNHFTLDTWVKPGRLPNIFQAIISKNITPRPPGLWVFGDKVQVWFDPGGFQAESTTGLTLNQWHHLAATYDGAEVNIYINGSLDVSDPTAVTPATNTKPLVFGSLGDNSRFFQGLIDEVEIFNRALSAAEIRAIFDAGSAGKVKPALVPTHKVVVPNAQTAVEGNSQNSFPFGDTNCSAMRYQQVYASGDIGGTGIIDKIAFRPDFNNGVAFTADGVSVDIRLSHTPLTADGLSATFADNVGPDETVVLDTDSLSFSSAKANCGVSGPCDFDIIIDLNDVFTYNGTGNLLLDIRLRTADASANAGFFDEVSSFGDSTSRAFNVTDNVTDSDGIADSHGPVTKFFLSPNPPKDGLGDSP